MNCSRCGKIVFSSRTDCLCFDCATNSKTDVLISKQKVREAIKQAFSGNYETAKSKQIDWLMARLEL